MTVSDSSRSHSADLPGSPGSPVPDQRPPGIDALLEDLARQRVTRVRRRRAAVQAFRDERRAARDVGKAKLHAAKLARAAEAGSDTPREPMTITAPAAWTPDEQAILGRLAAGETVRVQLPRGQRDPYGAFLLYLRDDLGVLRAVLRPGPWGSPFVADSDDETGRAAAVDRYRAWLAGAGNDVIRTGARRAGYSRSWQFAHLGDLAGKALGCRCPAAGPCHAEVLAELANRAAQGETP